MAYSDIPSHAMTYNLTYALSGGQVFDVIVTDVVLSHRMSNCLAETSLFEQKTNGIY